MCRCMYIYIYISCRYIYIYIYIHIYIYIYTCINNAASDLSGLTLNAAPEGGHTTRKSATARIIYIIICVSLFIRICYIYIYIYTFIYIYIHIEYDGYSLEVIGGHTTRSPPARGPRPGSRIRSLQRNFHIR